MSTTSTTTTTTTTTASTSTSTSIKRFELLTKLVDMSLNKSRKALSVNQLVQETYGVDASFYGGKDMLHGIVHNMLDKIDETTKTQMAEYLKEHLVKERLERIEATIAHIEKEEERQQQQEDEDHGSAHLALDQTLLPPTVTLEDVLMYAAYQKQLEQKESMTQALSDLEEEIASLEQQHQQTQQKVLDNAKTLQDVAKTLEQSADVCSMVAASTS
jgi:vacuolar-type H+-ATPase subunit I/STV1